MGGHGKRDDGALEIGNVDDGGVGNIAHLLGVGETLVCGFVGRVHGRGVVG
jgi:hypothetical protein